MRKVAKFGGTPIAIRAHIRLLAQQVSALAVGSSAKKVTKLGSDKAGLGD